MVAPKSDPSRWLVALKPRKDGNQMKAEPGWHGGSVPAPKIIPVNPALAES
jgi:hypothetical protein